MSLDNPKSGLFNVNSYQFPGLPWVTSSVAPASGSPVRYDFTKITHFIVISNRDTGSNTLSFGFTRNGVTSTDNKYIVNAGQTLNLEVMVREIYIQGETGTPKYSLYVGLTPIDSTELPLLTGSGTNPWIGVG
jgi:hypothetical protein